MNLLNCFTNQITNIFTIDIGFVLRTFFILQFKIKKSADKAALKKHSFIFVATKNNILRSKQSMKACVFLQNIDLDPKYIINFLSQNYSTTFIKNYQYFSKLFLIKSQALAEMR